MAHNGVAAKAGLPALNQRRFVQPALPEACASTCRERPVNSASMAWWGKSTGVGSVRQGSLQTGEQHPIRFAGVAGGPVTEGGEARRQLGPPAAPMA